MARLWAEQALTGEGWQRDVLVETDAAGRIAAVTPGTPAAGHRAAVLLPAPVNAHSHAFQRAMAGLTEARGPAGGDSFWTWRRLMYRFLERLTPGQVQAIAAFAQVEMLEAGFGAVAEFHYLHHGPDGTPHARLSEMSDRIAAAAAASGIGLTLLPVLYERGGCDGRALGPGQVRFGNDINRYSRLIDLSHEAFDALPADCRIGVAAHSLRAVAPESLASVAALAGDGPIHLHLAEQVAEVEEVRGAWRVRPVEWLLANAAPGPGWGLVHCTQMLPHETAALAATGAVAILCPVTEANLGDGIFDGVRWLDHGGAIALGSDSNILISLQEEIRMLEHSQRLRDKSRAALAGDGASIGRRIFEAAARGGAQAAGRGSGVIEPGAWADLLALDGVHVDLEGREGDTVLDVFAFAGRRAMVRDVWSAGRHVVRDGRHIARDAIEAAYRRALTGLRDAL